MTIESHEPPRLLDDEEVDAQVRSLLVAGRAQQPALHVLRAAPTAVAALLAAQGIAHSAAAATLPAAAPLPYAGGATTFATLLKWVGVGVVAGFSAAGVTVAATGIGSSEVSQTPPTPQAPRSGAHGQPPESSAARSAVSVQLPPSAVVEEPPSSSSSNSADETRPRRDSVEREVRLLDEARAKLAAGRPESALDSLDHAARLPRRVMEPEAVVLRVRALLLLQRRVDADRVARSWEARAPHSPQAEVLRKLLRSHPEAIQTPPGELSR